MLRNLLYDMDGGEKEMNVLVVDDDREIVDSISIFLSGEGYKAIKAYDGIEALDALSENEVHLMILDIMMPKLDGIKTLMKLRESRNIPVILLSAKSVPKNLSIITKALSVATITASGYAFANSLMFAEWSGSIC